MNEVPEFTDENENLANKPIHSSEISKCEF